MPSVERGSLRVVAAIAAIAAGLLTACAADVSPSPPTASVPFPSVTAGSPASTTSPAPTPVLVVDPGQPYDAEAILAAMRDSRRPGGVPAQVQTDGVASAVAEMIWTFDGEPWQSLSIGGSCGPASCTLDVAGAPPGAVGEDVYVLVVDPETEGVEIVETNLRGLTPDSVGLLDASARAGWDGEMGGLALATAVWQLPPSESEFILSYRSGGEEGAPAVDLLLDVVSGEVRET